MTLGIVVTCIDTDLQPLASCLSEPQTHAALFLDSLPVRQPWDNCCSFGFDTLKFIPKEGNHMRLKKTFRRGRTYIHTPISGVALTDVWSDDIEREFFLPRHGETMRSEKR